MPKAQAALDRFLRWTERYTRLDMVYLTRGGFWQTFGQASSALLSFLLVIVFANFLDKETYGLYRYALSLASILSFLTLTGMNQAVSRAVATGHEGVLRAAVRYQLWWNMLLTAALWALGGYYLVQGNTILAASLGILGISAPAGAAFNTFSAYLEGKRHFKLNNLYAAGSTGLYVAGALLAIFISGEAVGLVAAYAITTLIGTAGCYWLVLKKFNPPNEDAHETITYGRHLTFIGFLAPIAAQLDKIIVGNLWGASELAVYTIALAVPTRIATLIKGWVGVGFPKLAARSQGEIDALFYHRIASGLIAGAVVALAYIAVAPFLFYYLMPQYYSSVLYSQILAASLVFAMPNRYVSLLFAAQKLPRLILLNNISQTLVCLALYVAFGIWGGVLGLVTAQAIYSAISLLMNIAVWRLGRN